MRKRQLCRQIKITNKLNILHTNGSETSEKIEDKKENFPNSVASAITDQFHDCYSFQSFV